MLTHPPAVGSPLDAAPADEATSNPVPESADRRLLWRLDSPKALLCLFLGGFLVRLLLAPHVGFHGDLRLFKLWAQQARHGRLPATSTPTATSPTTRPAISTSWRCSARSRPRRSRATCCSSCRRSSPTWRWPGWPGASPSVWLRHRLRGRLPVRALVVAAVLFNPAVIALSAGWGQVDVVPAVVVLGSLLVLLTGSHSLRRDTAAMALFGVAFAIKPQSGFLFPAMGYLLCRRYLFRPVGPRPRAGGRAVHAMGAAALGVLGRIGPGLRARPVRPAALLRRFIVVYRDDERLGLQPVGGIGFYRDDVSRRLSRSSASQRLRRPGCLPRRDGARPGRAHRSLNRRPPQAEGLSWPPPPPEPPRPTPCSPGCTSGTCSRPSPAWLRSSLSVPSARSTPPCRSSSSSTSGTRSPTTTSSGQRSGAPSPPSSRCSAGCSGRCGSPTPGRRGLVARRARRVA